jgi:hypothetical protein
VFVRASALGGKLQSSELISGGVDRQQYEYLANFKVLQNTFKQHSIDKVRALVGRFEGAVRAAVPLGGARVAISYSPVYLTNLPSLPTRL